MEEDEGLHLLTGQRFCAKMNFEFQRIILDDLNTAFVVEIFFEL